MSETDHSARIGRVETEVQSLHTSVGTLSADVTGLKADVKGLGSILGRIEQGVLRAQERSEERETAAKPNVVALISVLITVITIIVGGAWVIGGSLARQDERSEWVKSQLQRHEERMWSSQLREQQAPRLTATPEREIRPPTE